MSCGLTMFGFVRAGVALIKFLSLAAELSDDGVSLHWPPDNS